VLESYEAITLPPSRNKYSASRDILLLLFFILRLLQYSFYLVVRKTGNRARSGLVNGHFDTALIACPLSSGRCLGGSKVPAGFPVDTTRVTCKPYNINTPT
jgi:hypothetical protein